MLAGSANYPLIGWLSRLLLTPWVSRMWHETACRSYEAVESLVLPSYGDADLQCTAESNACLLRKAVCCLVCLLQGIRQSRASAHAMHLHTGHKAGCLQHRNTQLRAMPVCHAEHSAASCDCKASGTAELQFMQSD